MKDEQLEVMVEAVLTAFDEKFGKRAPASGIGYDPSIGRGAGCDDCENSQEWRDEVRLFCEMNITAAMKAYGDERERRANEAGFREGVNARFEGIRCSECMDRVKKKMVELLGARTSQAEDTSKSTEEV